MRIVLLIIVAIPGMMLFGACETVLTSEKMEAGKKVYDANCLGCHMDNGRGVPRMSPPLVNSPYVMGHPASLIELVLEGSAFFGTADRGYNNEMASFHSLRDDQIADMLTYIRNTYAKTGDQVMEEDVKKVREALK